MQYKCDVLVELNRCGKYLYLQIAKQRSLPCYRRGDLTKNKKYPLLFKYIKTQTR